MSDGPVWDVATTADLRCSRGGEVIGLGEAFRRSRRVPGRIFCEQCSLAIDKTPAPARVDPLTFRDRLRDETAKTPARVAGGPRPVSPGSQPVIEPTGWRRFNRRGVVEAMRESFRPDFRQRATGEKS